MLPKNEHGVTQYPKGDARRLFVLLAAIDMLERPTISSLAAYTGHNKGTIPSDVEKLCEQFGVGIVKKDAVYSIQSWGDLLRKEVVSRFLEGR